MKKYWRLSAKFILAAAFFLLTTAVCFAQETSALEQIRELNRSGKWDQAQAAKKSFDSNAAKSNVEKCKIYESLIYAQTLLGRKSEAEATRATYDKSCQTGQALTAADLKMSAPAPVNDNFWQTIQT